MKIKTGQLLIRDRAQVSISNQATGEAGTLEVNATNVLLDKTGRINATTT